MGTKIYNFTCIERFPGWFVAICVAANPFPANRAHSPLATQDKSGRTRFLWPPICEVVSATPGFVGYEPKLSSATMQSYDDFGPFRKANSSGFEDCTVTWTKRNTLVALLVFRVEHNCGNLSKLELLEVRNA